jgi:hypothetical protein
MVQSVSALIHVPDMTDARTYRCNISVADRTVVVELGLLMICRER